MDAEALLADLSRGVSRSFHLTLRVLPRKVRSQIGLAYLLARASDLDAHSPLSSIRERFALPEGIIYLDGNSLGALPRTVGPALARVVEHEWGERLIRSWNEADWWGAQTRVGDRIGRLVGAAAGQIVVTDSLPIAPNGLTNLRVVSVAPLLGEAIRRIHRNESVSYLFD